MILEHEIPQGSKLHFGDSARLKREVEKMAVDIFYENDFEEIATPSFTYLEHQKEIDSRSIIKLNSEKNHQMALRSDTTLDAVRIITKRIDRSTNQKKWFYIQPVFSYPTTEIHQIGAEFLDNQSISKMLCLAIEIFGELKLSPVLQISNMRIPLLCSQNMGIDIEIFAKTKVEEILKADAFLAKLMHVKSNSELESVMKSSPIFLKGELERLIEISSCCYYKNSVMAPLYYAPVAYYEDLFFRMFDKNSTMLLGGQYKIDEIESCGFAIYTDEVVDRILKERRG